MAEWEIDQIILFIVHNVEIQYFTAHDLLRNLLALEIYCARII